MPATRTRKRPKQLKCKPGYKQVGAVCQPVSRFKKKAVSPKKGKKLTTVATTAATVLGLSAGAYAVTRKRYRDGFEQSAKMAVERAGSINAVPVKARQKAIILGVGGMAYKEESPQVISGERIVVASKLAFSQKKGKDFKSVPISNLASSVPTSPQQGNNPVKRLGDVGELYLRRLKTGRSENAVDLAANAIAWGDKNPDRPLVMMGHSAGGFDVHEAQEIIARARPEFKDRLVSFAFGSEYFGMTETFGESHTIGSPNDEMTTILPTKNLRKFSGVQGHSQSQYFNDPEVQKFVSDRIYKKIGELEKKKQKTDAAIVVFDDATPVKRVIEWQDFKIGIQYFPFQDRHGRMLPAAYGHFQKTKGADGMALDVYVGTKLESPKIYAIAQHINGEFDEEKMVIGVESKEEAYKLFTKAMPAEFFGDIRELGLDELESYRHDLPSYEAKKIIQHSLEPQQAEQLLGVTFNYP